MSGLSYSFPKTTTSSISNPNLSPMRNFSSLNQSGSKVSGYASGPSLNLASGSASNTKHDPFGSLMDFGLKHSSNVLEFWQRKLCRWNFQQFGLSSKASAGQTQRLSKASVSSATSANSICCWRALNMFFSSSVSSTAPRASYRSQPIPELNDWDMGAEFGGDDSGGTTTELEGLPPPPTGVNASIAKAKGMDNCKQGQFADAIKWLSWAVLLLEKHGDDASSTEVFVCRASCYKEVGEYKKAIADCSKVLEHDRNDVAILLQRALLYESSEKYRLGAEDLRMVLKIDLA